MTIDAQAGWTAEDQAIYDQVCDRTASPMENRPLILVINKMDLVEQAPVEIPSEIGAIVKTAVAQNQGIDALEAAILQKVQTENLQAANLDLAINQRQAAALSRAKASLQQVQATIQDQLPLDFWTIDLRGAVQALGEITGEEMTESMLGRIFSRFCIGK